jgi:hypothetical protein
MSNEGSITVNQVDVKSFAAALWNPQEYEIYIDDRKVGLLNGYQNQKTFPISPGPHLVYVRAYARNSVTISRVYGLSQTLEVNVSDGENKRFSCGRAKGPPLRKPLLLTSAAITLLLFLGLGPLSDIQVRTRYASTMVMALITMACSWIGHSSTPGTSIYLKEV